MANGAIDPAQMAQLMQLDPVTRQKYLEFWEKAGQLNLREIEDRYKLGTAQLKNAMGIAALQSDDRRAGIEAERDMSRERLAQAREEMERIGIPDMEIRRFNAEKNYEIAQEELALKRNQYALDVAKYGTELASTPDTYFAARRFQAFDAPRLLGQDTSTAQVYGGPTPQILTMGARLAGIDPATVGQQPTVMAAGSGAGSPATGDTDAAKQLAAIVKASPPSVYQGLDEQDSATLRLMESVYKKGFQTIPRGEIERLNSTGRLGFLKSAGSLLGYSPEQELATYGAYTPSQQSSSLG